MAAIANTVGTALEPSNTGVRVQAGVLGPDSGSSSSLIAGPVAAIGELQSGATSPCSTASGSTDQLCSVLVSQQLAVMGHEAPEGPRKVRRWAGPDSTQPSVRLISPFLQLLSAAVCEGKIVTGTLVQAPHLPDQPTLKGAAISAQGSSGPGRSHEVQTG